MQIGFKSAIINSFFFRKDFLKFYNLRLKSRDKGKGKVSLGLRE
jgi:hypothetical protein